MRKVKVPLFASRRVDCRASWELACKHGSSAGGCVPPPAVAAHRDERHSVSARCRGDRPAHDLSVDREIGAACEAPR
jgi:hypothetical protein